MPSPFMLNRRTFLGSGFAALAARGAALKAPKIDRTRISAISDEIAKSPADAIAFAKHFGMQWLELRGLPGSGKPYHTMDPEELAKAHAEFKEAGIRISFLNSPMLKYGLPGTEPLRRTPEKPEAREKRLAREQAQFDGHMDELRKAIRCCHTLECPLLRVFSFSRVAEPEKLYPRVAEIVGKMAAVAEKEGVKLLLENEASQNVGTSAEAAKFVKMLPEKALGINWDSLNGLGLGEKPYPDGYDVLPKHRILNVQIKGKTVLDYPEHMDWGAIFVQLEKDGYKGQLGLETHIFGEGQVACSHASMTEIMRIVDTL
ncbi:MAG TPA: sugar phosphate isomerase/epimerase family protein [Bryobacteraceae bacterium]|nr:sugar phosphate isomerase/epimerase family protein [Bryobacteraceae bacterium]